MHANPCHPALSPRPAPRRHLAADLGSLHREREARLWLAPQATSCHQPLPPASATSLAPRGTRTAYTADTAPHAPPPPTEAAAACAEENQPSLLSTDTPDDHTSSTGLSKLHGPSRTPHHPPTAPHRTAPHRTAPALPCRLGPRMKANKKFESRVLPSEKKRMCRRHTIR